MSRLITGAAYPMTDVTSNCRGQTESLGSDEQRSKIERTTVKRICASGELHPFHRPA